MLIIDNIELWNGDCLELMKNIHDKSVDCIICDLTYGTTACKWDSVIDLSRLWQQYNRIIKDKGAVILFGQEPFSSKVRMSNLEMYRYDWVWKKQRPSNFQLMGYQTGRVHENIMIFSKAKACYTKNGNSMVYNPQFVEREKPRTSNVKIYGDTSTNILHNYKNGEKDNIKTYTHKYPISILEFNTVERDKLHPTQKPVPLLEYLIKTYTDEGETVLDNCIGSGSTGVACVNTNRKFIGIELDDTYFEIAKNRIREVKMRKDKENENI